MKTSNNRWWIYEIDIRNPDKKIWETHTRFYKHEKQLSAFDLHTIPLVRKNAVLAGITNKQS